MKSAFFGTYQLETASDFKKGAENTTVYPMRSNEMEAAPSSSPQGVARRGLFHREEVLVLNLNPILEAQAMCG